MDYILNINYVIIATRGNKLNNGKIMWRKCSVGTGVTDFNIGINGWILFSLLHCRLGGGKSDSCLIIFNHTVWERTND